MKFFKSRFAVLLLCALLLNGAFSGCSDKKETLPEGAAKNDIVTFENNADNKPIIRIGMQYYAPDNSLADTLAKAFPDYLFVLDYSTASGTGADIRVQDQLERGEYYDLVVSSRSQFVSTDTVLYCDLSAESFLNNYLLASLNNISSDDGRIFFLPGVSTIAGIAYNTEMFEEHGWQVPATTDEFFALCEEIKRAGIDPFSNCLKYSNQVNNLFGTMCYDRLFTSDEDIVWMQNMQRNNATYTGHMEPLYELAKRFADEGISTIDDFSASLTKQRQAFWAGEHAMMFYDTGIYSYAAAEKATFDVGLMPFPAEDAESSGYCVIPAYYMAIPKLVERDPERLALIKDILAYLSTPEGQRVMLGSSYNISNVKGVDISENPAFEYIREAYERGNLYPQIEYISTGLPIIGLQQESIKTLFEGASVKDALTMMDESLSAAFAEGLPEETYEVVAQAETDFTMLETSYYLADKLREASGAEIGLMINRGYFRSNLADLAAGDITSDMRRFIMKGVGAEDFLTTYRLTGAQLKELIEHPIINGSEIDALIAASGLKIEYAPWNERGSRVLSLTLEDGSKLVDDTLYTVAAWAGVIDERYITETVETHDGLGQIDSIVLEALKRDKTIKPDIENRLTLVWG